MEPLLSPLLILAIGIAAILFLIVVLRAHAFLALIVAAMLVSTLAGGPWDERIARVANEFGVAAGKIGVVIALAAIIGQCMMESGAADRIVRSFLNAFGQQRAGVALLGSGYVLGIPVFFDTVFYLLVPLARSLYERTGRDFLKYVLAISAGGALTHTLVPPTPGPLTMAAYLEVDIGLLILVGATVAFPAAIVGLIFANVANRLMPIPARPIGTEPPPDPLDESQLPGLIVSILPVALPVLLISGRTVLEAIPTEQLDRLGLQFPAELFGMLGDANFALLVAALVAMVLLTAQRGLSLSQLTGRVEKALLSGGVIILITAAGGAFGAMLRAAQVGDAITAYVSDQGRLAGFQVLLLGFAIALVLKIAQGSSTVAMITTATMVASMGVSATALGFDPVYLCTAIGSGSLVGSWMNDSGFWIFSRMSGITEVEALKSWTVLLVILGSSGLAVTLLYAWLCPRPLTLLGM